MKKKTPTLNKNFLRSLSAAVKAGKLIFTVNGRGQIRHHIYKYGVACDLCPIEALAITKDEKYISMNAFDEELRKALNLTDEAAQLIIDVADIPGMLGRTELKAACGIKR